MCPTNASRKGNEIAASGSMPVRILTPPYLEKHYDVVQQTVKEFTANRRPIFEPGTADDS